MKTIFYDFYGYNQKIFTIVNCILNNDSTVAIFLHKYSLLFQISNGAIYYCLTLLYFYFKLKPLDNESRYIAYVDMSNTMYNIGVLYAVFAIFYTVLKFTMNFPRPYCSLSADAYITIVNVARERCLSSFPSSHVGLCVLINYIIWPYSNLYIRIISVLSVLLCAISRIGLAMHYPADILYGVLLVLPTILLATYIRNTTMCSFLIVRNVIYKHLFSK